MIPENRKPFREADLEFVNRRFSSALLSKTDESIKY
jgi:hypothetical protein